MSIYAGIGSSKEKDLIPAAQEALRQAQQRLGNAHPNLIIVFASGELSVPGLLKIISAALPQVPIIGCSSSSIITPTDILKHGIVIALLNLPGDIFFNTACVSHSENKSALEIGEELGKKLLYAFQDMRRVLSIVFSDALVKNEAGFLTGLQERLGLIFPLLGISVVENPINKQNQLYFNQSIIANAACGILLGGRLTFTLSTKHGWKPLGKPRYVTKSSGNILHEIDGQPAVQIYEEYLATNISKLKSELKRLSSLYPIGIHLAEENEYLLRNALEITKNGSLVMHGDIPEGSTIRFMISTKEACLEAAREAAREVKNALHSNKADFILILDSVWRSLILGRQANNEIEIIKEELGADTPMLGFYTAGEHTSLLTSSFRSKIHFHSQSITILALSSIEKAHWQQKNN
ncbi:MAG: FIST N-terminal domain-containing protein [Candidatus Omnitrophota bacterium]